MLSKSCKHFFKDVQVLLKTCMFVKYADCLLNFIVVKKLIITAPLKMLTEMITFYHFC